jgi:hypothetical protein
MDEHKIYHSMPGANEPTISMSSGSGSTITGGSPKIIYTIFLIGLCKSHFDSMEPDKMMAVNYKTAALIAYCPSREKRDELWTMYSDEVGDASDMSKVVSASVHAIGELMSYLNSVLEFETTSTAMIL